MHKIKTKRNSTILVSLIACYLEQQYNIYNNTYTQSVHSHDSTTTTSQTSKCLVLPTSNIIPGKITVHYRASSIWNEVPLS